MKRKYKTRWLYGSLLAAFMVAWTGCAEEDIGDPTLSHITPTVSPVKATMTPTAVPVLSPTKKQEAADPFTPTPTATASPTPTSLPPTATTVPTPTSLPPTATTAPTPTVHPYSLVYAGWQQVTDSTGTYMIVFPDSYDEVSLTKGQDFFYYTYTASQYTDMILDIGYYFEEDIAVRQTALLEQYPEAVIMEEQYGFSYTVKTDTAWVEGKVCVYEALGTNGVMQIENRYAKESAEEYQQEQYRWYLCIAEEGLQQ